MIPHNRHAPHARRCSRANLHGCFIVLLTVLLSLIALVIPQRAAAEPEVTDDVSIARAEYAQGNELARAMSWGEALGAFESSLRARPHALTLYNIGVCERVLGRATRARERFQEALARAERDPSELAPSLREEVAGFIAEYERLLARVPVKLAPKGAGLAVDGRPLRERRDGSRLVLEAGILPPGIGQPPSEDAFELELDPGTHVITVSRPGYRDVVVTRDFPSGENPMLELVLAHLPATIRVSSSPPEAIVRVDDVDIGLAPISVTRPPGTHRIVVSRAGYTPFVNHVVLGPGEQASLRAELSVAHVPVTRRWWFWTGAVVALAGAAVITYAATRPSPSPRPYDGGSAGWIVQP